MTKVPFARHVRAIAGFLQRFRDRLCFEVEDTLISGSIELIWGRPFIHVAETNSMVVSTGHEHRARNRAGRSDIERAESEAFAREAIQVWRRYFTAVATKVRETQIISDDDNDVRPVIRLRRLLSE